MFQGFRQGTVVVGPKDVLEITFIPRPDVARNTLMAEEGLIVGHEAPGRGLDQVGAVARILDQNRPLSKVIGKRSDPWSEMDVEEGGDGDR